MWPRIAIEEDPSIEHDGDQKDDRYIDQHRRDEVMKAPRVDRFASGHRRGSARWMNTAQVVHGAARKRDGECTGDKERCIQAGAGYTDDGRYHVPPDQGPGLGERPVRDRKQQHRERNLLHTIIGVCDMKAMNAP
jgi:hypothetical protein